MIRYTFKTILALTFLAVFSFPAILKSQPLNPIPAETRIKPYRILTSGKDVTIKSKKTIKEVLVWTSSGYRIVENRDVNATSFSFTVKQNTRIVFVMIHFEGGQPFTEKIGL